MVDQYSLEKKSIKQALNRDWQSAILTNTEILEEFPQDIPALNRLAKAQIEFGQLAEAKINLNKVLSIDTYNSVAKTNLQHVNVRSKNKNNLSVRQKPVTSISFIEEPGKTKVVSLTNLGDPLIIDNIYVGEEVFIKQITKKIKIVNENKQYIGSLPDDLSNTLYEFLKIGNKYKLLIRSSSSKEINVFILETKKSAKLKGMASFPDTRNTFTLPPVTNRLEETPLEIFDTNYPNDEIS